MYTKESLQLLKDKIDLIEVVSSYIDVKRAGVTYKALCPFHEEKTPSFTLKRGDTHYHCFGCGAHGDAISFIMQFQGVNFVEAVETLAEKFHVLLQTENKTEHISSLTLQEVLASANQFFHYYLLHTQEGKAALDYLFKRGISLDFIKRFEIGYAPQNGTTFLNAIQKKKWDRELLLHAGLLTQDGKRPFFRERIMFPVRNGRGSVIAFSARKIKEETFGGKYINTSETQLFKKSRHLFGLNYSKKCIVKERKAILVEGQIDCLKMIFEGFDNTIATLGTAFGQGHAEAIKKLGVHLVKILFDSDHAGLKAASKAGDLLQKEGVEVEVITLPDQMDPDTLLNVKGKETMQTLLKRGKDYLTFQVELLSQSYDLQSPASKAELALQMKQQINNWNNAIQVHESMRKLAEMLRLPEEMIGVNHKVPSYIRAKAPNIAIDPNKVLEMDLLRLLLQGEERFEEVAKKYIQPEDFTTEPLRKLYMAYLEAEEKDLFSLMSEVQDVEVEKCLDEICSKKVHVEKIRETFLLTVQKVVDRRWLKQREEIHRKIHQGGNSEERVLELVKEFDSITRLKVEYV